MLNYPPVISMFCLNYLQSMVSCYFHPKKAVSSRLSKPKQIIQICSEIQAHYLPMPTDSKHFTQMSSLKRNCFYFSAEALDFKERLIATVKKEVKQVMEEAVTRKFVHEDSGSVTSLCAAVEACLSQGLLRRALGLFKTSSTTALLHKVAKHCIEAKQISQKVSAIENSDPTKRSSSSGDSTSKPPIIKKNSSTSITNNSATSPPPTIK